MARISYPPLPPAKEGTKPGPPPPNVSQIFSHSTATAKHWGAIANAHFTQIALPAKLRELTILLVTAKLGSVYEHSHHARIAEKLGVSNEQRGWIVDAAKKAGGKGVRDGMEGEVKVGFFEEKEGALLCLVENVVEEKDVDEKTWGEARKWFGERELVEIVSLVGFYFTFSRITTVFQIELDAGVKPKL